MDKIKTVKIKNPDGSVSEETYTISIDAKDVDMKNGKDLQDTIGDINVDKDGSIAEQLVELDNVKKKPYYYNSVADMKADNKLKNGDMVITLGYYKPNDGGAAEYKIINGTHTVDNGNYHKLDNDLYAELIIKDILPKLAQFGFVGTMNTPHYSDDCSTCISNILNKYKGCYIQKGYYITSNSIILNDNSKLILEGRGGLNGGTPSDSAVIHHITNHINVPAIRITGQGNKIDGGTIITHQATLKGLVMIDLSNEFRNQRRQMNNNYINTCLWKWEYVAGSVGDGSIGINIYTGENTNQASGTGLYIDGVIFAFDYGIYGAKGTGSTCWLSSIEHKGIIMNCCQSVHLNRMSTGSKFSGIYQPNLTGNNPQWAKESGNLEFVHVQNILIDGFVWDIGGSGNKYAVMCGDGTYDLKYLQDTRFGTTIGYTPNSYVFSNNAIIKSDLPYNNEYSNGGLLNILSFADKQMVVNYILSSLLATQTIGQEYNKVFNSNYESRLGAYFKIANDQIYSDTMEYGYEIIFPRDIRVYDIGVKFASLDATSNYIRFEGLRQGIWQEIKTIKTIYNQGDNETVFGINNTGNTTAYIVRNDTSDPYKNSNVSLDGIRIIFIGMTNKSSVTISKVWARTRDNFFGGNYLTVGNDNDIYGRTKFIKEPVLISPNGTSYFLRVNDDGTLTTLEPSNNPVNFYLYENNIILNKNETKNIKVVLKKCPIKPQTINFISNNTNILTVTNSLTFTALNWNIPQEIVITPNSSLSTATTGTITATSLWATQQTINVNIIM